MSIPIKIQSIIEELEMQFDESQTFLNRNTGEIVFVKLEDLRAAEDEEPFDHLPDWEQEDRKIAIDVVENFENYLGLPTKYEVNEYEIMEEYCLSVSDQVIRDNLLRAIKGKGAFRRFKEKIIDFGIEKNWYSFRDKRFKEIAINWCNDNNIDFIE
jgi:hypothetical protein